MMSIDYRTGSDTHMECYFTNLLSHPSGEVSYVGEKDGCPVFVCVDCGLIFCPKVSYDEYVEIYREPRRYFEVSVSVGYASFEERFEHDYSVAEVRVRNLFEWRKPEEKTVLDVGCGNCALIRRLQECDFEVRGVDLDSWSVQCAAHLVEDLAVDICDVSTLSLKDEFDVIMFTDSFEHLLNPLRVVERVRGLLRQGGLVVIEMPNVDSDGWAKEKIDWRHVKPLEHPFLYARRHVEALFERVGMRVVGVVHTIPGRVVLYLR